MAEAGLNNIDTECSPAKKIKLDAENGTESDNSIHETEINLSTFELTQVLQNNCTRKQICLLGTFKGREDPAIVFLEKKNFPVEKACLEEGFFGSGTTLKKIFRNDIYGNYEYSPIAEHNGLNVTVLHPATPIHIKKFSKKETFMVDETYEIYEKITLPHIKSSSLSIEWIQNILDHKAEQENIIYEDTDKETGFALLKDLKWDGDVGTLKLIALPFKNILCIRELDDSHLPLLKNIRDASTAAILKKYNVPASQLRIYFHYQPSYYYLHVHFGYLMFENPGIRVEKAHLLSSVIRNIELMPDYYKKAVLSYTVAEGDPLCTKFQEHGILGQIESKPAEA